VLHWKYWHFLQGLKNFWVNRFASTPSVLNSVIIQATIRNSHELLASVLHYQQEYENSKTLKEKTSAAAQQLREIRAAIE